jgi:hypothetical protein
METPTATTKARKAKKERKPRTEYHVRTSISLKHEALLFTHQADVQKLMGGKVALPLVSGHLLEQALQDSEFLARALATFRQAHPTL